VGPASERGAAYHVNLKGRPTIQRVPRTALGPPRHPNPGNYAQYECKTKSPDGTKIAFYRPISNDLGAGGGIAGRVGFICVMNPDGTGKHRLTQPPNGKPISRPIECPHTAP
jgi:hypothetical protein